MLIVFNHCNNMFIVEVCISVIKRFQVILVWRLNWINVVRTFGSESVQRTEDESVLVFVYIQSFCDDLIGYYYTQRKQIWVTQVIIKKRKSQQCSLLFLIILFNLFIIYKLYLINKITRIKKNVWIKFIYMVNEIV